MKKQRENATKLAQAIATLRKLGLTVTDETKKDGSIGIAGVHDQFKNSEITGVISTERLPAKKH
jgi:hypothetical protein